MVKAGGKKMEADGRGVESGGGKVSAGRMRE